MVFDVNGPGRACPTRNATDLLFVEIDVIKRVIVLAKVGFKINKSFIVFLSITPASTSGETLVHGCRVIRRHNG